MEAITSSMIPCRSPSVATLYVTNPAIATRYAMPTTTKMPTPIFFNILPSRSFSRIFPISNSHITKTTRAMTPNAIRTSDNESAILPIEEIRTHATPIMYQIGFIPCLLSGRARTKDFAPIDCRREQSQHAKSISYRVLPYAKLQQKFCNPVIIGQKNPHLHSSHHKNADNAVLFTSHCDENPQQQDPITQFGLVRALYMPDKPKPICRAGQKRRYGQE